MKLLINGSNLSGGGGVQVALSFILESRKFPGNEYYILASDKLYEELKNEKFPSNYIFYSISLLHSNPIKKIVSIYKIKKIEKQIQPDSVFTIFGPAYWTPKSPHLVGFALGHLIYPESPYFKSITLKERIYWEAISLIKKYFFKKNSSFYHVETQDAKKRLAKYLNHNPEKIFVVSNTYNPYFDNFQVSETFILPPKDKNEYRLLLLSTYYSHKNFEIINKITEIFSANNIENIKFVVTINQNIFAAIFGAKNQYIINTGPIPANLCPQLYFECDALFLPTLVECFTANYPEAMKMKKPILTSDLPFAHGICGDAAIYFDPLKADDIVEKIVLLKNNPKLSKDLVEKGIERLKEFDNSAKRTKKYLEICNCISTK
ncbi:MAG: glycosyltransferase family 4 protein [Bacteroidales bacterium]|nr:glycosyltransferase family 4 protein [Bacteroidales bacterium]